MTPHSRRAAVFFVSGWSSKGVLAVDKIRSNLPYVEAAIAESTEIVGSYGSVASPL